MWFEKRRFSLQNETRQDILPQADNLIFRGKISCRNEEIE